MMLHRARLASFRKKQKWPGNVDTVEMSRAGFFYVPDDENPDNCECFFCGVNLSGWRVGDDPAREHLLCNPECQWARVIGTRDHTVSDRLGTFSNWPHPVQNFRPSPLALAQAGFYFNPSSNTDDSVECAFCNACLNKWEPNDSPRDVHLATSPECEFILQCFETSSLVESSLGVIPVLQPGTRSQLPPPNDSYEQSVYGNILEQQNEAPQKDTDATPDASIKSRLDYTLESSSVYETAVGMSPDATTTCSNTEETGDSVTPGESLATDQSSSRDSRGSIASDRTLEASSIQQSVTTSMEQTQEGDTSLDMDREHETTREESLQSRNVNDTFESATPPKYRSSGGAEKSQNSANVSVDSPAQQASESQGYTCNTTRDADQSTHSLIDTSMVSVDVEEVSTLSAHDTQAPPTDNLEDPETPNDSRRTSVAPERPALSVFSSAFTSTPFGRMSPRKMMSSAAMPSPLSRLPIDLGRTSFGDQAPQEDVTEPVMYPRLPSFPTMHNTATNGDIPSENTPFNESEVFNLNSKPVKPLQTIEETSYRAVDESDLGRDHSTPSPIRSSQAHSFMVGSSPVKNSFDQLIQDLDVEPNALRDSFLDRVSNFPASSRESLALSDIQDQVVTQTPQGLDSRLDSRLDSSIQGFSGQDSLSIEITKPIKKTLVDEFSRFLPPSSVEFLMEAKGQTVGEWQLLLADEVERQVLKITEEAVQEAESHRQSIIASIKSQYGQ